MAKIKYSIIACSYANGAYLKNFLWTVSNQDYGGKFETIIVDNGTKGRQLASACHQVSQSACAEFIRIEPSDKISNSIGGGINLAAEKAVGRFMVIVANPNILLSFNLLSKIDASIKPQNVVISAGPENDVKILPTDDQQNTMEVQNEVILKKMGWPADPFTLKLLPGAHRFAPQHTGSGCYIAALSRMNFYKFGGYPINQKTCGPYHDIFTKTLCAELKKVRLKGIRIIHQLI